MASKALSWALEKTFSKVGQISLSTHFEAISGLFCLSVVEEFIGILLGI